MTGTFPAQPITTPLEWSDLVLDEATQRDVADIVTWVRHHDMLMNEWRLARRLKPGFRSFFHGPPGTGKTLTACLLGKQVGLPVYRVDLAKIMSNYIGEAGTSVHDLFESAQREHWILFFDEADALFGKRTERQSANDRAADLQAAYLLRKIEDYPWVAITATNLQSHVDDAFARRFQSVIQFRMPDAEQRLRLWRDSFRGLTLAADVDLERLAQDYELCGGNIVNVLRYACLQAVQREPPLIGEGDLLEGVRRELRKDGRSAA